MLILSRTFSSSCVLRQDKFLISGTEMTREQILAIRPALRAVAHWLVLVDWDLWETRPYVVVDPFAPNSLLYLNQADYLSLGRTCVSNDLPLMVIATPSVVRPSPVGPKSADGGSGTSSQNSPLPVGFESKWSRSSRASWKTFLDFRSKVRKGVPTVQGSTMVSEDPKTIVRTVMLWGRELLHYTEVKNSGGFHELLHHVARHLAMLLQHNGQMGAIKHLKTALFVLYSYMSGNPIKCSVAIGWGIRLTNGLPSYWPRALRDMIRSGNLPVIRVVASILNLYRAMDAKHPEFSTASITAPHPNFEGNQTWAEYEKFVSEIFPKLLSTHFESGKLPEFKYESAFGMLIRSAGANLSGPSIASAIFDAQAWAAEPKNHVLDWFRMHRDSLSVQTMEALEIEHGATPQCAYREGFHDEEGTNNPYGPLVPESGGLTANGLLMATRVTPNFGLKGSPILSRLHTIDEPAGKVRVVAICDYWTQVALKPVHEFLFTLLKGIASNDATFDQDGVVHAYFQRGLSPHWSFDLKTATDSIPLALYKAVLYPLLRAEGESPDVVRERVDRWASILTDRDFYLPVKEGQEVPLKVRYGTGQPMGALSSWASMALVHHSLVQFAHYKATSRVEWYKDYLVLGDDVDIASLEAVSTAYRNVCADFSITIGLAKSLQSKLNCFEFANRRYIPAGDISPLSFREELACSTWTQRLEFAKRILRRLGKPLTEVSALLRRAVTSAQWTVLTPEMSGSRPLSILRLVHYCLLNPLQTKSGLEELRISSVLEWITNVLPDEDVAIIRRIKVDKVQVRNLSRRLVEHLRKKVFEEFRRRVEGKALFHWMHYEAPPADPIRIKLEVASTASFGQNVPLANYLAGQIGQLPRVPDCARSVIDAAVAIIDEQILAHRGQNTVLSFAPPLSPVFWRYFRLSVWETNRRILTDLLKLWDRADDMAKRLPPLAPQMYERDIVVGPDFELNTLGEWIQLWIEVLSLPKAVTIDLTKSLNYNLDYNSHRSYVDSKMAIPGHVPPVNPETIYGPMLELATTVAEFAGVSIPNLPFFGDAKKGKQWIKSLSRSQARFKKWSEAKALVDLSYSYYEKLYKKPRYGSLSFVLQGARVGAVGGSNGEGGHSSGS